MSPSRRLANCAARAAAIERFHAENERLYTFAQRDTPVEIVTLEVAALGTLPGPSLTLTKLGPTGATLWQRSVGAAGTLARGIWASTDAAGNVLASSIVTALNNGNSVVLDTSGG